MLLELGALLGADVPDEPDDAELGADALVGAEALLAALEELLPLSLLLITELGCEE